MESKKSLNKKKRMKNRRPFQETELPENESFKKKEQRKLRGCKHQRIDSGIFTTVVYALLHPKDSLTTNSQLLS